MEARRQNKEGDIFSTEGVYLTTAETGADSVNKFKGPAKRHATPEWFESQYAGPSRIQNIGVMNPFTIDWHNLAVYNKTTTYTLGVKPEARIELVYNEHGAWVDTRAIHVDLNNVPNLDENYKQLATVTRNHYKKEERVMPKREF
ncbi:hypothetical protein HAX54_025674 [Datura stramonium]|uniref:Uncharacterized protein n=1 Tax=Datura stramonium TaxID=4076 RepID=A0ABS8V1X0_DATST|nr:hypothetical protein [Datura stramonium]